MARKRRLPPLSPNESRKILKEAGIMQKDLADDLDITRGSVTHYLNGVAYSRRFWDHFFKRISHLKAS